MTIIQSCSRSAPPNTLTKGNQGAAILREGSQGMTTAALCPVVIQRGSAVEKFSKNFPFVFCHEDLENLGVNCHEAKTSLEKYSEIGPDAAAGGAQGHEPPYLGQISTLSH